MRLLNVVFLATLVMCATSSAKDCEIPIGRIDGIQVRNERIDAGTVDEVTLRRQNNRVPVSNSLPLCAGDLVSVATEATVIVKLGRTAEEENTITLYGGTTTELSAPDSLLLRLGRIFASLKAPFKATTLFGWLGARGTTFEIEATEQGASVLQLEGEVDFDPNVTTTNVLTGARLLPAAWMGAPMQKGGEVHLGRLTRLRIGPTAVPRTEPIASELCAQVVSSDSAVVAGTRPAQPLTLLPTKVPYEEAAAVFQQNRSNAVCREDRYSTRELADAYTAWGRATDAVRLLEKAGVEIDDDPFRLNDAGNTYRLAGDLDRALDYYRRAMARNRWFAFPYNGTGDVYRDRALREYGKKNVQGAREYLEQAKGYYESSLDPSRFGKEGGWNRAVALYNLGELHLMLALIDPDNGEQLCESAKAWFNQALDTTNGNFPFGRVGLARVWLVRAQLVRPQDPPEGAKLGEKLLFIMADGARVQTERRPFLKSAEKEIQAALERWPNFSLAEQTWGEILEVSGDRRHTEEKFRSAVQLDANNSIAYARLGRLVRGAEGKLFQQVAEQIEPRARAEITSGRIQFTEPLPPKPTPQNASTASVDRSELKWESSGQETVKVRNLGPGRLRIQSVSFQEPTREFRIVNDGCSGRNLPQGQECGVSVSYSSTREGSFEAVLLISHSGANSPLSVRLSGHAGIM